MPPATNDPNPTRGPLRRFVNRLEVDRAVFFALLLRAWQLFGGMVSLILIGLFLRPDVQGYYYLFAALMGLQSFFELGFNIAITNLSSHEWARLTLDEHGRIAGDETALSRLVSLGRLIFKWYGVASLLFVVCVGVGGAAFIAIRPATPEFLPQIGETAVDWKGPWTALVMLSGLLLWTLPFNALLEGCGQVATVYRFRVAQAISANIAVWVVLATGGELWAAAAATAARLATDLVLLGVRYREFFRPFLSSSKRDRMDWQTDILPLQWRLAVSGVFGFFAYYLFTPVMWAYHGKVVAGQMGMTWTLVTTLQMAALAWVQARVPRFGVLIAKRDFPELDRIFKRLTAISLVVVIAGSLGIWCCILLLNQFAPSFAVRLLDPLPTGLFLLAIVVYQVPHCQVFYVRAHKHEPFLPVSIVASSAIGASVWWLGAEWGPVGAATGYLAVVTLIILPCHTYLWQRCRKQQPSNDTME